MAFWSGEGRRAGFSWSRWSECAGDHCTGMPLPVPAPVQMEGGRRGARPSLGSTGLGSACQLALPWLIFSASLSTSRVNPWRSNRQRARWPCGSSLPWPSHAVGSPAGGWVQRSAARVGGERRAVGAGAFQSVNNVFLARNLHPRRGGEDVVGSWGQEVLCCSAVPW